MNLLLEVEVDYKLRSHYFLLILINQLQHAVGKITGRLWIQTSSTITEFLQIPVFAVRREKEIPQPLFRNLNSHLTSISSSLPTQLEYAVGKSLHSIVH